MESLLVWIVVGLAAGWLASLFLGGGGLVRNIIIGMIGSIVGGYVFAIAGVDIIDNFWVKNILVATVGAVIVIIVARIIARK